VSRRLEQALIAAGERVVRVAPHRMGASRRGEREPGKSDEIDALAVARAVVKDGPERFPAPPTSMSRRWRSGCSPTTARIWSSSAPGCKTGCAGTCLSSARARAVTQTRRPGAIPAAEQDRPAPAPHARLRAGTGGARTGRTDPPPDRQADALERELLAPIKAQRPQLLAETGCGALTAAIPIGRTAGAERFASDASFAHQTGTAPIPCSSGQRDRHRLDRGGDRQLNHALHIIAITRARHDPATRAYPARKEAEGKTKKGAPRCLKRHLARRFHQLLSRSDTLAGDPPVLVFDATSTGATDCN
jgi:transposase